MKRCGIAFALLLLGCESEPSVDAMPALAPIPVTRAEPIPWHEQVSPKPGPPRVIGSYTAGCMQGAVPLMPEGRGYQVMRLDRGRFFGHPTLVDYIEDLGASIADRDLGVLLVGDLSLPRGGPTMTDHRSHQNGLDVDLWYRYPELALERSLTPEEREQLGSPAVVDLATKTLTDAWDPALISMLELAADDDRVERVFVHPAIKRELCEQVTGDRTWLRKIRPWRGHHDHLHVRLACPPDSDECKAQATPPRGEGCGKSLDWWFRERRPRAKTARKRASHKRRDPALPASCEQVQLVEVDMLIADVR